MTDLTKPISNTDLDEVLRLTAPAVWQGLRGQSLFITGGTGFVGKWLLECLLHADRELNLGLALSVLTRSPDSFARSSAHLAKASAVDLVQGDVVDFVFPRVRFSTVVHAALPVAPPQAQNCELQRMAAAGASRVCEFASVCGARRLLHISSGAVYGAQAELLPMAEDARWSDVPTVNDYTSAKRLAESVVAQAWPFEVVIARCFAFIGPYLRPSSGSAAAQFINRAASGRRIVVEGTGSAVRSYQYAGDMTRWLLSALSLGASGRAYNIGADAAVTIAELAHEVARLAGSEVPPHVTGGASAGLAGSWYVPDLQRARTELGLSNAVDLDEGIRRTLAWRASVRPHSSGST